MALKRVVHLLMIGAAWVVLRPGADTGRLLPLVDSHASRLCPRIEAPSALTTAAGWNVYVERPRAAVVGDGVYLLGVPTFAWHFGSDVGIMTTTPEGVPLIGVRRDAHSNISLVPAPDDGGMVAQIRIAVDVAGAIHAIWSRSDSSADGQTGGLQYATYAGAGWSRSEVLSSLPPHRWDAGVSELLATPEGLVVAMPGASRSMDENKIHLLRYREGSWETHSVLVQAPPSYVALALAGDTLAIAYVAPDIASPAGFDRNSVFVLSADESQRGSFSLPRLVSRSGRGAAHAPVLLAGGSGDLALVWYQLDDARPPTAGVRFVTSEDGGHNWNFRRAINQGSSGLVPAARFINDSTFLIVSGSPISESDAQLWFFQGNNHLPVGGPLKTMASPGLHGIGRDSLLLSFTTTAHVITPSGREELPVTNVATVVTCQRQ